jgi:hypothetical protein
MFAQIPIYCAYWYWWLDIRIRVVDQCWILFTAGAHDYPRVDYYQCRSSFAQDENCESEQAEAFMAIIRNHCNNGSLLHALDNI